MSDDIQCPECGNDDIWDLDCPECNGATEVQSGEDEWVICEGCDGEGVLYGNFQCSQCHHVWEEV